MHYAKSTGGFYTADIHGTNIPGDAVRITAAHYRDLLEGQCGGKMITGDALGNPILVDPPLASSDALARHSRDERDHLLTLSDWTQAGDVPQALKEKWVPYRQALRDVPQQPGFPDSFTWPTKP